MPGCVLRVSGAELDVDGYLAASPFRPCAVFRRGEPLTPGSARRSEKSGFNLEVGAEDGHSVQVQVRDAAAFVASQQAELERLAAWPGVESVTLDFGWNFPCGRVASQYHYFPPSLLAACGTLGIGIEVSVYAMSGVDQDAEPRASLAPEGMT